MPDFRMPIPPAPGGGPVAKATSVTQEGEPDGYVAPLCYKAEVLHGGVSRLVISAPPGALERVHRALVNALKPPFKLLYVQMVDRARGVQLPKPRRLVAVDIPRDRLLAGLHDLRRLVYEDARHQLWIRGAQGEQLVLEETGVLFVYPDDFLFREVLESQGVEEREAETLADRDYLRVNFDAACDAEEADLLDRFHLLPWEG
jgi:hypothetical protein